MSQPVHEYEVSAIQKRASALESSQITFEPPHFTLFASDFSLDGSDSLPKPTSHCRSRFFSGGLRHLCPFSEISGFRLLLSVCTAAELTLFSRGDINPIWHRSDDQCQKFNHPILDHKIGSRAALLVKLIELSHQLRLERPE